MAQRDEASVAASADLGVSGIPAELAEARATIDNIDAALVHILAERFRCTQRTLAASSGLDPDFAEKFLGFMVREVIRHHEDIKAEYDEGSRL